MSEELIFFLFTPKCYDKMIKMDIDGFVSDCASQVISKLLGYSIMIGAAMVKIPQITKILSKQSAEGLSILSIYIESIGYSLTTAYFYRSNYALSTYGENPLIYVQNIILLLLIYSMTKSLGIFALLKLILFIGIFGLMLSDIIPLDILSKAYSSQIVILLGSRLPQIIEIMRNGSTGALSFITSLMNFAGCIARVFTTLQEVKDDPSALIVVIAATVLNGIIFIQFLIYWNAKSKSKTKKD